MHKMYFILRVLVIEFESHCLVLREIKSEIVYLTGKYQVSYEVIPGQIVDIWNTASKKLDFMLWDREVIAGF